MSLAQKLLLQAAKKRLNQRAQSLLRQQKIDAQNERAKKRHAENAAECYQVFLRGRWWREFRFHLLYDRNFTCARCGFRSFSVHVHHLKYPPNHNWKATTKEMCEVLCENCHQKQHLK